MKRQKSTDKKRLVRELEHLTRPPRLEGKTKDNRMNRTHKKKKTARKGEKKRK